MTPVLRPARSTETGSLGAILYDSLNTAEGTAGLYSLAETIAFCGVMIDRRWVTVAEQDGRVVGFMALDGDEICSLYIAADAQGQGIGQQLLAVARQQVSRLTVRAVQANIGAQRFYLRHGFTELGRGNGHDNEENLPNITYVWQREGRAA
ncbi:GNAT family N-acetyltransferase [Phaeobacter gallaeciensis]|uniref:GNAT family N-acetyltransferase n=2 Tax=Roseobacteraceae TaxID=2854170 RepID=A0A366X780_9RHOB|nr:MULTISPECIES: GNAT family N-acetyltransferase [Roseobacteraceae]MBT3142656.1 GNAT family N-acetyltransferase [Falsiruegeria litorea]MBT8168180.1 GNAT family N-acetyltransferase [Falsiruegeria litorea]RBW61585.1 GNAT family N-acetyltransferase [Phaeobacter gallaeciensis]